MPYIPFSMKNDTEANLKQEELEVWKLFENENEIDSSDNSDTIPKNVMHPAMKLGLGVALLGHAAIILSLPPVIRGKGAPFLPTSSKNIDSMFQILRKQSSIRQRLEMKQNIQFLDLGSGDGRVVFRAARESLFHRSIGVEINPVLHGFASIRRAVQPKYWNSTNFYMKDLWKMNLSNSHVIAVYGLHPIMDKLGQKMVNELPNGAIVVSNVFTIPGWKPKFVGSVDVNMHFYSIPESVEHIPKS